MRTDYDVVVIGAGIHGAGVAQAAAARGYRVLVLEKNTVASGTSSKSSKLIHGGLRYLETGQFSLVRECLAERAILLRNAPDLVRLKAFIIPVYKWSKRRSWQISLGLQLYAFLSGFKPHLRHQKIPRRDWQHLDGLDTEGLVAVYQYYDAQTDDALLTQSVLQSALEFDTKLSCHAKVRSIQLLSGRCEIEYQSKAAGLQRCSTICVVNATGPWVAETLKILSPPLVGPPIDLVQGSHILINQALVRGIYYVESRSDGRAIFVMPWYGKTLVGTTEKLFLESPDKVRPLDSEIKYLIEAYTQYFPGEKSIGLQDVTAFSGLRVLPSSTGSAFKRPRETTLITENATPHRFVSIYGGKLTAYRATAEKVLTMLSATLPPPSQQGDTRQIPLLKPISTQLSEY